LDNEVVKLHGDPTINHHDWVIVSNDGKDILCYILCFVRINNVPTYFVDQNVFKVTNQISFCTVMAITLSVIIQMKIVALFEDGQSLLQKLMVPTYLKQNQFLS